jgi:hypothetical protein
VCAGDAAASSDRLTGASDPLSASERALVHRFRGKLYKRKWGVSFFVKKYFSIS